MNTRRLSIAFLIALAVSGLCTWLLAKRISSRPVNHPTVRQYVAASHTLEAGEVLKADSFESVEWPVTNVVAGGFATTDGLVGRAVLYPIAKDQPITERFLSAPGSGAGLASEIPPGMRAIALRSDEVMGVAGFLSPGSHLDVLVTYRSDRSPEPITLTVLQDAEVLAAGQKIQPDPEGKPVTATVVTLLLTPEDAQRAVLASTQGAIHFVLRGGADKEHVQSFPLALSQLSSGMAASVPVAKPAVARVQHVAASRQLVVETIAGDKQTSDSFSELR